ncbi:cell wall-associated NlpC family hydrolase [Motilibacter rhizosphaerae]|uniref:Cell wall-associated NlpC family hydrolase n=1 Tax=Motilibacter rhizosphaerae TaxID=598652 RepID=A0A4Q7NVY0_9ACTN|nr:NlpC/P60 family protein [Motilibacter rhizosphaerae]RZS91421.1 cell wall-associated NlpC family hydrolase [Motilibacter rhizosphaerae]
MSVPTMEPSGLAQVQSRMAALQAQLGGAPQAASVSTSDSSTGTFADSLSDALGTSGTDASAATGTTATGTVTPATPATPTTPSALGQQAVELAKGYVGVPYLWGGTDPSKGLDCSGLVQLVYGKLGVDLPRVSRDQATVGTPVADLSQAQPGDLLFFHTPVSHVGIYAGGGKMVEAPRTGKDVQVVDVYATPTAIRRVTGLPQAPAAAPAASGTPYADLFRTAGASAGVSPQLLAAVAKVESGYRPDAVSPAGAEGLMQLMPSTAAGLGVDPTNPAQAVQGAAKLLSGYLKDYAGDVDEALAAYDAGPAAVRKHGGVPPYAETRAYVQKVRSALDEVSL